MGNLNGFEWASAQGTLMVLHSLVNLIDAQLTKDMIAFL